jgi:2-keto-4-pentenoate hydratase/2-oxohepta-3-ene-1,7-dioic acid hydratase in catechol pathway
MTIVLPQVEVALMENSQARNLPVGTIYGLGKNFAKHIVEGQWQEKEAVIFLKPRTSLFQGMGPVKLPEFSANIHFEVELVLYLGKGGRNLSVDEASTSIYALGIGVDLTARDMQDKAKKLGHPWALSKGFDNASLISRMVPYNGALELNNLGLILKRNGEIRQNGNTAQMILKPLEVISYISRYFSLFPGDVIFCGTPEGVGQLAQGDRIEIELLKENQAILSERYVFTA